MFTGIIRDVGVIRRREKGTNGHLRLVFGTALPSSAYAIGESVACAGVCLTVVAQSEGWFAAEVSAETLARTLMGGWEEGAAVNLEPALRAGDPLGGHYVTGHVDGVVRVESVEKGEGMERWRFGLPAGLEAAMAEKGSVALDGVSLTVNEVDKAGFAVNLIPHTLAHTTFRSRQVGDAVHLEIDPLARYVLRALAVKAGKEEK